MAVSQETLMRKMKEALTHAEQHMHTDEFAVSIGKLHVLCELVLEDTKQHDSPQHRTIATEKQHVFKHKPSVAPQVVIEKDKGDSIFDF